MEWLAYDAEAFRGLLDNQNNVLFTDGEGIYTRGSTTMGKNITHYMLVPDLPKRWWEALPKEAVWFVLAGVGTFVRTSSAVNYWLWMDTDERANFNEWVAQFPTAQLVEWR